MIHTNLRKDVHPKINPQKVTIKNRHINAVKGLIFPTKTVRSKQCCVLQNTGNYPGLIFKFHLYDVVPDVTDLLSN
jgi:hypothetical protein